MIKCDISQVIHSGRLVSVAISSGPNGITFYVDGKRSYSFSGSKISHSDLSAYIIVGSSPLSYQPWNGEMYGFAVYAKELTDEGALQHYRAWGHPEGHSPDIALSRYTFAEGAESTIHNEVPCEPDLEIPPKLLRPP